MQQESSTELAKAAKYLCTTLDGLCPMVVEKYPCPEVCGIETLPWKCWIAFFRDSRTAPRFEEERVATATG